jgi:glycosyltransferase involved in cell wall biosynthesis
VRLLGVISHARLLDDLRAHRWDAAVLPSIVTDDADEGIPVALMEAMASGLPVLSTRTGAIPELLDGGAGLLVAGGDAKAFADGLERLAGDSELRALLAVRGRRRVEREFDVVQIASTLVRSFAGCS